MSAGRRLGLAEPESTGRREWREPRIDEAASSGPSWVFQAPRVALVGWVILLVLGLYLIRLWQLQFLEGGAWRTRAVQQQSRLVIVQPPRGVIYDSTGEILVRNVPAY